MDDSAEQKKRVQVARGAASPVRVRSLFLTLAIGDGCQGSHDDPRRLESREEAYQRRLAAEMDARRLSAQAVEAERRKRIEASSCPASVKARLMRHSVWIGMSRDLLLLSKEKPEDINRTVTTHGVTEQWTYRQIISGRRLYVYLENGIVTGWQD